MASFSRIDVVAGLVAIVALFLASFAVLGLAPPAASRLAVRVSVIVGGFVLGTLLISAIAWLSSRLAPSMHANLNADSDRRCLFGAVFAALALTAAAEQKPTWFEVASVLFAGAVYFIVRRLLTKSPTV